jgi:formyltetrahydrofolate deformylase
METAILLIQCADQKGIVAKISDFAFRNDANIIASDQHSTDPSNGRFFMRLEFCFDPLSFAPQQLEAQFAILAHTLQDATWRIHYVSKLDKMGILVSKQDHCLCDILYRWKSGELRAEIPIVISNHENVAEETKRYGIPFIHLSLLNDNKTGQEKQILSAVKGKTDFLVLARYMQILSDAFVSAYSNDIINIHHSFLPSFKGANPYRQAFDRGVKIIGATAHYVTGDLDEGPIIEQAVDRVSHRDNIDTLKRKGRNLETIALANAIRAQLEHRIIRYENKTIVFE